MPFIFRCFQSFFVLCLYFLLGIILAPSVIIVEIVLKCKMLWNVLIEAKTKCYQTIIKILYPSSFHNRINQAQSRDNFTETFEQVITDEERDSCKDSTEGEQSDVDYIQNNGYQGEEMNTNVNEVWYVNINIIDYKIP
ncbi:10550_t:CDS:2 [Funneliformis mosseae]|uniref:10550_t:CDS:1 n=1 Tax=Funneliformis mosseae TaxID=27381 RepID=A0A9N8W6V8_FUNMO|nr:10550_t:CDS:2 [Funneliformis mosseae]